MFALMSTRFQMRRWASGCRCWHDDGRPAAEHLQVKRRRKGTSGEKHQGTLGLLLNCGTCEVTERGRCKWSACV